MLPAACCSGLGASLRGPAAGICSERLGQPVRRPAPESCSFTQIVIEIKEQNSVSAPLCRPRCRAAPRAPRPGKQGPAVPPAGQRAAIWPHCPRRARARGSGPPREGAEGGGRWPLPSARDKGAHRPARRPRAGPFLPAGTGAARGSRPGAGALIALVCAPPLFSPDKFLGEKLGSFIRRSLAVSAAFQRTWFQGGK